MQQMVTLTVDDRRIQAKRGTSLLQACLDGGIYIPHLCHMEGPGQASASCRLCLVHIDGESRPVTSCSVRVESPVTVRTDTAAVRRLQKCALALLLSVHRVECKSCPANRKCPLQDMARFLKVGLKGGRLQRRLKQPEVDGSHPHLNHYPNRCVLCGKCIQVCRLNGRRAALTFAGRGFHTVIQSFGHIADDTAACATCRACVDICPVGALVMKEA